MTTRDHDPVRSGGVDIQTGDMVFIGGDVVGRDKISVFDSAAIQWLALEGSRLANWLRLAGISALIAILVSIVAQQFLSVNSSPQSGSVAILNGAAGALIGSLIAWYSPSLTSALLRVAWVEGALMATELTLLRLFPAATDHLPNWFGLPILHASLLVALVAGPWLTIIAFTVIRLVRPARQPLINRRWKSELLTLFAACLATGLFVAVLFRMFDTEPPPADPSAPPVRVEQKYYQSGVWGLQDRPDCEILKNGAEAVCVSYEPGRFKTHQDGFISLPGWLSLSQAIAILIALGMIIPAAAALSVVQKKRPIRIREPLAAICVGFAISAVIGAGLDMAAASASAQNLALVAESIDIRQPSGLLLTGLVWGMFGMITGVTVAIANRLLNRYQAGRDDAIVEPVSKS
jgi:hypothetical protein